MPPIHTHTQIQNHTAKLTEPWGSGSMLLLLLFRAQSWTLPQLPCTSSTVAYTPRRALSWPKVSACALVMPLLVGKSLPAWGRHLMTKFQRTFSMSMWHDEQVTLKKQAIRKLSGLWKCLEIRQWRKLHSECVLKTTICTLRCVSRACKTGNSCRLHRGSHTESFLIFMAALCAPACAETPQHPTLP